MKYIIQKWEERFDGILFFVQRMEEMLFHYSEDIVKAAVHNTVTLLQEYIQVERDANISRNNLKIIAEEIVDSLEKDVVLKEKFGAEKILRLKSSIKQDESNTVHYLISIIPFREYSLWCSDYLKTHLPEASHKNEIQIGLRQWLSSAIWAGYAPEYLYRHLKTIFGETIEDPLKTVMDFIDHFSYEKKRYKVYFVFQGKAFKYRSLFHLRLDIDFEDDGYYDIINCNNKAFIGHKMVDAIDPYNAREKGMGALNTFVQFYKVLSNRTKPILGKNMMVRDLVSGEIIYLPVASTGYRTIEIPPQEHLKDAIDGAIIACQEKPRNTFISLSIIIKLHNTAIQQNDLEDGFVNLWSIMEVISQNNDNENTIEKVINSVLPILQNDFFVKYFSILNKDLRTALPRDQYKKITAIDGGNSDTEKVMHFVFLPEHEQLRETIFEVLAEYPNIRNKVYRLYSLKENRANVYLLSKKYAQRLTWHLYRMYRLRNKIVHSGGSDKNIQVLGEHLHFYCDSVICEIIAKLAAKKYLTTIRDVLFDGKMLSLSKEDYFKNGGCISKKDISLLISHCFEDYEEADPVRDI